MPQVPGRKVRHFPREKSRGSVLLIHPVLTTTFRSPVLKYFQCSAHVMNLILQVDSRYEVRREHQILWNPVY